MSRIALAFRSFFSLLFSGRLPDAVVAALNLAPRQAARPQAAPVRQASASDGALQVLAILQRDARLVDFLMEDISSYSDDQVGAAVRSLHDQCGQSLKRYLKLDPVIDGVEGTFTKIGSSDPGAMKLLGNVPADGKAPGGTLRHKGWRAQSVDLPPIPAGQNPAIIAPAEIEIE